MAREKSTAKTGATHIALLRGVNVGGHRLVSMSDLVDLLGGLGFAEGRSFLQSGNLLFRSETRPAAEIERILEVEAAKRLGLETDVFVRTAPDWKKLVAANPFPKEAEKDPGRLLMVVLKSTPGQEKVEALRAAIRGPEQVGAEGRQAYAYYPNGAGRSKLTHAMIEKHLQSRGTARNWNTVLRLARLAEGRL